MGEIENYEVKRGFPTGWTVLLYIFIIIILLVYNPVSIRFTIIIGIIYVYTQYFKSPSSETTMRLRDHPINVSRAVQFQQAELIAVAKTVESELYIAAEDPRKFSIAIERISTNNTKH